MRAANFGCMITEIVLTVLGGLALFLFAVGSLADVIQEIAGDRAKTWLVKLTGNLFTAILTGIAITTILDSSSAVIIITIVLVNSKLLTFRQAIGIVLGANIGTTVSSQIPAMDVGKYSPVALVAGLAMMMLSRSNTISKSGKVLLFFGMMFFGLYTMERAVEPLKGLGNFDSWMRGLEHPLTGALTGALVTLIIQSSSATVGMAITLAKKEAITLAAGVAVMLGAELGTCSDTLLATIKGSRAAVRTGVFHLFFNFTSIVIGLLLFGPFIQLVEYVSKDAHLERKLANAHVLFNVCGVLLFIGFVPFIEALLNRVIPDKVN